MLMDVERERLINRMRRRLDIWGEIDDETLLKRSEGTLTRALVELDIAAEDFNRSMSDMAVREAIKIGDCFRKLCRKG